MFRRAGNHDGTQPSILLDYLHWNNCFVLQWRKDTAFFYNGQAVKEAAGEGVIHNSNCFRWIIRKQIVYLPEILRL
jgi:hypothetical protein